MKMVRIVRGIFMKMVEVISREIIKPSSPTPSHLQTHNLSLLDQGAPYAYIPMIFFYQNHKNCYSDAHEKARKLKKSLSESLTKYYPFAGRFPAPAKPYVDCNDEGVVFLEALVDSKLEGFLGKVEQEETLDRLFPDGLVWFNSFHNNVSNPTVPVAVQLNHFACGGVAVAVSISHKIGDGSTLLNFMNHWAAVARCGSVDHELVLPLNPHFVYSRRTDTILPEARLNVTEEDYVTRKFVFPNSKLSELKNKVIAMAAAGSTPAINSPTRVEVVSALLYTRAATTASECFNSSGLCMSSNMRNKMVEKLPETTAGNVISIFTILARNKSELTLNAVVAELQNGKKRLAGIRDVEEAGEMFAKRRTSGKMDGVSFGDIYFCSSLCRFRFYMVDFGWGKPVDATLRVGSAFKNAFFLMDARDGDGIEALVTLGTQHMGRFRNDKELLAFTDKTIRKFSCAVQAKL